VQKYIRNRHFSSWAKIFVDQCNSSTEKASFKLINEILLALNIKLTVGGIFCDLEKAFGSLNPHILLSKCEFYGFRVKTNALL